MKLEIKYEKHKIKKNNENENENENGKTNNSINLYGKKTQKWS